MTAGVFVGVGAAWKGLEDIAVGVGGAWKTVLAGWVGVGGSWVPMYTALAVSAASAQTSSGASSSHTFGTLTSTVTGGVGPFTYVWHESDDAQGVWTAGGTSGSQPVAVSGVAASNASQALYSVTVTDTGTGAVATSNGLIIKWTNT